MYAESQENSFTELWGPTLAFEPVPTGSFQFQFTVEMPGTPDEVFSAATGDISPWWHHSMAENPVRLHIEVQLKSHLTTMKAKG